MPGPMGSISFWPAPAISTGARLRGRGPRPRPHALRSSSRYRQFRLRAPCGCGPVCPLLVESGGLVATTCGYYGVTPDAVPLIGFDAELSNLVHAAGFSGHGVMHAPVLPAVNHVALRSTIHRTLPADR